MGASRVSQVSRGELSGRRLILWLFVLLALATFATLVLFAQDVSPAFRPRIYATMVGDLMAPVIAWQAFRVIERRQAAHAAPDAAAATPAGDGDKR